jgi:hypothetical protein
MKYFITYLLTGEYKLGSKVSAKSGVLTEVPEDIYVYLTNTFGDRGWFTFKKDGKEPEVIKEKLTKPKKKRTTKQVDNTEEPAVEQDSE